MKRLSLRARLLWLANELDLYSDLETERRARRAYRDAAAALRRTLAVTAPRGRRRVG